jgi:hypothetical protein
MSQIKIFEKNYIDIDNTNTTITVTDSVATSSGQSIVNYIRNRNNTSAWLTTDSTDAANTEVLINMADTEYVDTIILIGHNFKAFTIQYLDTTWKDFSTAIAETTNTDATTEFTFTGVYTSQIKIIITGCQVVDADKQLKQLIITKLHRQLEAYPTINRPTHARNRSVSKMISGKNNYVSQVGGFSMELRLKYWSNVTDLAAVEQMYLKRISYLIWPCGGNETQFATRIAGYRKEDIYLMRPSNDYSPAWFSSLYNTGLDLSIPLVEVTS